MNSETRTKLISWLKSPKSLAAKAGIGLAAVAVVSVGTVSAMTVANIASEPETKQDNAVVAENTTNDVKPAENVQKTADLSQNTPETTNNATETTQNDTNNAAGSDTDVTTKPAEPAAPVYSDSYPAEWQNQCGQIDTWGLTKCQSTSYAAWKVSEAGKTMPKYWGDASTWVAKAEAAHIPYGSTPKLHSVAITGNFNAFVEAVNGDTITVSWYNWNNTQKYGTWENVPASQFSNYIYF